MAGTPEEDLLSWLEREEEELGFTTVGEALTEFDKARELFLSELNVDLSENQFEGLKHAQFLRYDELPKIGISYGRIEQKWGWQDTYRDVATGRFVASEDVYSLLATIR